MIYIKFVTLANLLNLEVVRVAFFANDKLMSGEKIITNHPSLFFKVAGIYFYEKNIKS